jgi:hypothetical protein
MAYGVIFGRAVATVLAARLVAGETLLVHASMHQHVRLAPTRHHASARKHGVTREFTLQQSKNPVHARRLLFEHRSGQRNTTWWDGGA